MTIANILRKKENGSGGGVAASHSTRKQVLPLEQHSTEPRTALERKLSNKCDRLIDTTYRNNCESDYTERISALSKGFNYRENSDRLWSEPAHSLLYGTPLYGQATEAQKLALNHLSWFANYNYISNSETETVMYNQVTGSVFETVGYSTLSDELSFETEQEQEHIKAFRKVGLMTATSLIGRSGLSALLKWNSYRLKLGKQTLTTYQYYALRSLAKTAGGRAHQPHYSQYLQQIEAESAFILKTPTAGMLGRSIGPSLPWQSFYGFSWGTGSPFMACQFYTIRMIANLYLKNMEHAIAKYARRLENDSAPVPAPTAISRCHFLDEAFHTTISRLLARDLYRVFDQPSAYESAVANSILLKMQKGTLGGLSAVLPHRYFADDFTIFELLYQLLQSPVFGFNSAEAQHWMKLCLCAEHTGIHVAAANRERLLKELKDFFCDIPYLWSVNREMSAMAGRGTIETTLAQNKKALENFWQARGYQAPTKQNSAKQNSARQKTVAKRKTVAKQKTTATQKIARKEQG
ncbi:MAG: hypothetical protein AAF171_13620 [Cyanobacteria bacterium P01_A01_bin.116]